MHHSEPSSDSKFQKSLDGYLQQSLFMQALTDYGHYSPSAMLNGPYTFISSSGDLDRLGILSSYFSPEKNSPFTITDIVLGAHIRSTSLACLTYQINGELQCHFSTALDGHTVEEFDQAMTSLLDWMKLVL